METKAFERRAAVAMTMEEKFLETYFGKNREVLAFARSLIMSGNKHAAKALNKAISVLGSNIDSRRVIDKISQDFKLNTSTTSKPQTFSASDGVTQSEGDIGRTVFVFICVAALIGLILMTITAPK